MSSDDFIPHSDAEFNIWQANLTAIVEPNLTTWSISTEDFTALKALQTNWTTAFTKASNKQTRSRADVLAKDESRQVYEKGLRGFTAQWLASNSKISNPDRERMGITVKKNSHTPTPVPVTRPVCRIDFSIRLQHTISFADEATPRSMAKPVGVHGCEIWMKIDGEAPKDASELTYLATDTNSPYLAKFSGAQAGKIVYYWLRWINNRAECGPWSGTFSAMVVG